MVQVNSTPNKSLGLPLLTWEDPVKTGKVFGALIIALAVLKSVNLLSLFFRLGAYSLITSAAAEYFGKLITGTGLVTRFRPAYSTVISSKATGFFNSLAENFPAFEQDAQKLLYSFNIENTLKAAGSFYILFKITSWVSLFNLILTSTILAFTVPAVYERYQTEINAAVAEYSKIASEKAQEYTKLAQEKAAPYIKQADEKLGPVSKFIKQKYQVRTASTTVGESAPAQTFATTTGAQTKPESSSLKANISEVPVAEFPSVPETTPLVSQVKEDLAGANVDVEGLKTDILKNKAAPIPEF